MLQFGGERELIQSPEVVFDKLRDARFLVSCVPDVQKVLNADREVAMCKIKPSLAFVMGTLDLTINVKQAVPHSLIRIEQVTKGIGNSSTVDTTLQLSPSGEGTKLVWSAEVVQMGGLLKALPEGLLKGAAEKVIGDTWVAVLNKLQGEE
jgi:carbon monoxide dehydrogenase subunit G